MSGRDPLALAMLAMEVGPLVRDLAGWQFVGVLAEQVHGAAAGHDGITQDEIATLRAWSRRWQSLPARLRLFYACHAPQHEPASVALWHTLRGTPHEVQGITRGALRELWLAWAGADPPWTLTPRVP